MSEQHPVILSVSQALSLAVLVLEFEAETARRQNIRWYTECVEAAAIIGRLKAAFGPAGGEEGHLSAYVWPQNGSLVQLAVGDKTTQTDRGGSQKPPGRPENRRVG
jgi:hypothetical protein